MLIRLCSDSLFNLADNFLNFSGILFSSAISFQVGVLGKLAGLLLDCAFDFVKLACCLIVRARFHHDSLLCLVVGFNLWRPIESSLRLERLRPGKDLFWEVSLPDVEPSIDQYPTIRLLKAGQNCASGRAQGASCTEPSS